MISFPLGTTREAIKIMEDTSDKDKALDKLVREPELFLRFFELAVEDKAWMASNADTMEKMAAKLAVCAKRREMKLDRVQTIEKTWEAARNVLESTKQLASAAVSQTNHDSTNPVGFPVVMLICNPRTVSTAFERSFIARGDFTIMHEPYLQCWAFRDSGEESFNSHDKDLFDKTMSNKDLKNLIDNSSKKQSVFIKDMVIAIYEPLMSDVSFMQQQNMRFTFLIRHPAKVLISYYKKMSENLPQFVWQIPDIQRFDLQWKLIERVNKLRGEMPIIIDADDLVSNPTQMMKAVCENLKIDFIEEAMNWEPTFDDRWKSWSAFHDVVSKSTSFQPTKTGVDLSVIPDVHRKMIEDHCAQQLPFYEKMYEKRLRFEKNET